MINKRFVRLVSPSNWMAMSILGVAAPAHAALMVISPIGSGVATGSPGFQYHEQAIDQQPTWDSDLEQPVDNDANTYGYFGGASGNTGYFDFGPDFADLRIYQVWTRYPPFATRDNETPPQLLWWDDDFDTANDGTTETILTFLTPGTGKTASQVWIQDVAVTTPVIPQGRYLLFQAPNPASSQGNEVAFIGEVIPEPASLALLMIGGVAVFVGRTGSRRE